MHRKTRLLNLAPGSSAERAMTPEQVKVQRKLTEAFNKNMRPGSAYFHGVKQPSMFSRRSFKNYFLNRRPAFVGPAKRSLSYIRHV